MCVDLDGTLLRSDMLYETALYVFKSSFWQFFLWPFFLIRGKAFLKYKIARLANFDPGLLPYRQDFLAFLKNRHSYGQKIILCTASDKLIAQSIADYLSIFDEIIASDGLTNLAGENKAKILVKRFGKGGFEYAGNSTKDLHIWQYASVGVVVNSTPAVIKAASQLTRVDCIFERDDFWSTVKSLIKSFRIHQWLKNLLLFIPLLAAHKFNQSESQLTIFLAFIAFSFCASSVYILNDLFDIESDRAHPRKCKRPFASGDVSIVFGIIAAPLLLLISIAISVYIGTAFFKLITVYFSITCAYSWKLKKLILIDCLVLALLYTIRIIAGAVAAQMPLSFWLLAFSVFLFLSLAFVKRYAELEIQLLNNRNEQVRGRGYFTSDASILQTLGITAGFASAIVLSLYLNSEAVLKLYKFPEFIWGAVPILLFWISWIWMQAHRGNMHDDPVVFAVKDKVSIISGIFFILFIWLGAVGI